MKLIHGDCVDKMKDISDNSIDMVMTSPPYDNLRDYGKDFTGWGEHIWKPCLDQIFRVLKDGGVCVWVVGDATINGSETGTSFRDFIGIELDKEYFDIAKKRIENTQKPLF